MLGRAFLVLSVAFVAVLGFAFYQDASRPYGPIQERYFKAQHEAYPGAQIYQLFPQVKVNGEFKIERCITCHVPDIAKLGPQEAANRLTKPGHPAHPAVIDDALFKKYGEDTSACQPAAAAAVSPSPAASPAPGAPRASPSPQPAATPAPGAGAAGPRCADRTGKPYQVLGPDGRPVTDPQTGQPMVAAIPGLISRQYLGLGIDGSGCIICHNGNRQGTTIEGAHQNLIPDPFRVFDRAPQLYENSCAQCHGTTGEGLKGPPLNDQDRLGFFTDEYYHKCIYLGNLDPDRKGTIMPPWGKRNMISAEQVQLLTHWIRQYQDYKRLP